MRTKNLDLVGTVCLTAMNVGWVLLFNRSLVIGTILGILFVLILPGYALTCVLFRGLWSDSSTRLILQPGLRLEHPVGAVDIVILSLGLSLAIDVLVGFILNVSPIGLRAPSWAVSLGLVTVVFSLFALYRRRKNPAKVRWMSMPSISLYACVLFCLAILVASTAIWFSIVRPLATTASFTQFWILPSIRTSSGCSVVVGMQSYGATSTLYRIVVTTNGTLTNLWPSVVLAPGAEWEQTVSIRSQSSGDIRVDALLYRADKPDRIYREAHLIVHQRSGEKYRSGQVCTS